MSGGAYLRADGTEAVTGDLVPSEANGCDLGSAEKPFARAYVSELYSTEAPIGASALANKAYVDAALGDGLYTPVQTLSWPGADPTTVIEALDTAAARILVAEGKPYTAGTPGSWAGAAPVTITLALDRLAALVKTLNSGTGA